MQSIFRLTGWTLVAVILALSLAPASARPVTGAGQGLEHLSIFLAVGAAFNGGYSRRPYVLTMALVLFAALVEIAQMWAPGRHARMSDFLIDSAASCLGVLLSCVILRVWSANR